MIRKKNPPSSLHHTNISIKIKLKYHPLNRHTIGMVKREKRDLINVKNWL